MGIAVFGYDKPGCGESSGDWTRLTFADRAVETVAAVAAVATQPEIDADRLGLLGAARVAGIAPLAANIDSSIKTVVTFSGRGVSVAEGEEYQVEAEGAVEGYTAEEIADALALYQRVLGRLRAGHGTRVAELAEITSVRELEFFAGIADHDPVAALEKLTCPIPAIFAADDVLVPTQASVNAYQAGFARSGHQRCGRCQRP